VKGGWLTLPRRFFDGPAWRENRKLSKAEALLDFYQRAQWDAGEVFIRGKLIQLDRGEQAASCRFLAERWGWTKDTVARFLKTMERDPSGIRANSATPNGLLIRSEVRQGETVLIICNYEDWTLAGMAACDSAAPPDETQLETPGRTAARQGRDKAKEGKELNEEKESKTYLAATVAEQIVGSYPRREATADCLRIVAADIKAGEDPGAMLAGTLEIAAAIARLPSGHLNAYVLSATRFFKEKRWMDDPATWLRQADKAAGGNGKAPLTDQEMNQQIGGRLWWEEVEAPEVTRSTVGGREFQTRTLESGP
jgi:hypothetical protein